MSIFNTKKIDATEQPIFFGEQPVNIARYDKQKYNIFEKLTDKQLGFFWRPEEVDISKDSKDFKSLTDHEKAYLHQQSKATDTSGFGSGSWTR